MQIIKDLNNEKMFFYEYSDCISSMHFIKSFFIWRFDGDRKELNPMVVTKDQKVFYDNLSWLMDQDYVFSEESAQYSSKTDKKLEFISDQINTMGGIEGTPRLVIIKRDQAFEELKVSKVIEAPPFEPAEEKEEYGFPIRERRVAFGPAHNGQAADNVVTEDSLQDDIIRVYKYTIQDKRIIDDPEFMDNYNKLKKDKSKTLNLNM